jgi:hypothetical protein
MKAAEKVAAEKLLALDFFASGVPTGMVFEMSLEDLDHVISLAQITEVDRIAALCFIGATSYFEAFCKDHAASIVNIAPSLIENLRQAGHDTRVDAQRAVEFGSNYHSKVGCLLMETYDFGTAKRINAVYNTLLKVTPFSKNEIKRYDEILRDRNLLVHHGGIYTSKYLEQRGDWSRRLTDAYWQSLIVTPDILKKTLEFLECIAKKISKASHAALSAHLQTAQISLEPEREKALNFLLWQDRSSS